MILPGKHPHFHAKRFGEFGDFTANVTIAEYRNRFAFEFFTRILRQILAGIKVAINHLALYCIYSKIG
jgi:hypothetical protein